jgi:NADH dehydrogenase/NADH:ubiquinone oxidoreductase subunit G
MISFTINGILVQGREDQTILQVARSYGIAIPGLCRAEPMDPYLACRRCVVEVDDGKRSRVVISGLYPIRSGIKVQTDTLKVANVRRWVASQMRGRRSPQRAS